MKITCPFITVGKPTVNKRVYPKEVLEKALEEYSKRVKQGIAYCEIETIEPKISLVNCSHRVLDIKLNENQNIECDIEILETPMGKKLKELFEMGKCSAHPIFIATTKIVTSETGDRQETVDEGAVLINVGIIPIGAPEDPGREND